MGLLRDVAANRLGASATFRFTAKRPIKNSFPNQLEARNGLWGDASTASEPRPARGSGGNASDLALSTLEQGRLTGSRVVAANATRKAALLLASKALKVRDGDFMLGAREGGRSGLRVRVRRRGGSGRSPSAPACPMSVVGKPAVHVIRRPLAASGSELAIFGTNSPMRDGACLRRLLAPPPPRRALRRWAWLEGRERCLLQLV